MIEYIIYQIRGSVNTMDSSALGSENRWYRLDNAAKIYPAISSSKRRTVFRVAVQLLTEVNPKILQEALFLVLPRFPAFAVKMKKGLFWYYFEPNTDKPVIVEEKAPPCRAIDVEETNGFLFRVSYFKKRINLEVFHALTDGTGAVCFLKTLLFRYLAQSGYELHHNENVIDFSEPPNLGEIEDSFRKYYLPKNRGGWSEEKAYQVSGPRVPSESARIIQGIIILKDFIGMTMKKNVTVTEYIAALIIYSIYATELKGRECYKPVKVSVPVNLRNLFPSRTLRNFSSYMNIGISFENREYSFDEILFDISKQMRANKKPEKLKEKISANVNAERNLLMRMAPLFIKDIVLKTAFNLFGEKLITCTLSNLGCFGIPESMEKQVERFEFLLGPPAINMLNCTVSSFKENLTICFVSVSEKTDIEKHFFHHIVENGLGVIIETNRDVSV